MYPQWVSWGQWPLQSTRWWLRHLPPARCPSAWCRRSPAPLCKLPLTFFTYQTEEKQIPTLILHPCAFNTVCGWAELVMLSNTGVCFHRELLTLIPSDCPLLRIRFKLWIQTCNLTCLVPTFTGKKTHRGEGKGREAQTDQAENTCMSVP